MYYLYFILGSMSIVPNVLIRVKCFDSNNTFFFKIDAKANPKFVLKIKEALCINLKNLNPQ